MNFLGEGHKSNRKTTVNSYLKSMESEKTPSRLEESGNLEGGTRTAKFSFL